MANQQKPRIGIMIGDPGGVGPEVVLKALQCRDLEASCRPVLIGSFDALAAMASRLNVSIGLRRVSHFEPNDDLAAIPVLDDGSLSPDDYRIGSPSAQSGRAVWSWIEKAHALAREGELDGFVLAPVSSESLLLARVVKDVDEMLPAGAFVLRVSGPLRIVPISEHVPLRCAADLVTVDSVLHLIRLVAEQARRWGILSPRVGVAGLNPHAKFTEDAERIAPAIARAKLEGIDVRGPVPPDTVFRQAIQGEHDFVITMYHDQGQIALKTSAFEGACSVVLGLPYLMIGVSHGTAFDIAGQGKAQHYSMLAAVQLAASLAAGKGLPVTVARSAPA